MLNAETERLYLMTVVFYEKHETLKKKIVLYSEVSSICVKDLNWWK